MTQPTLYMMFGYPGAGKTTIAEIIAEVTGATRLSSDEIRFETFRNPTFSPSEHTQLYTELNKRTKELLQQGVSVIYDANLNRHQHRQEKYDICKAVGATPQLIWVQTAKQLAKQRATHDSRLHFVPKHETAHHMFDRIADILEEPTASEPCIVIDGTRATTQTIRQALGL